VRTIIHLIREERVYKLLWVNEDADGFYLGLYGPEHGEGGGGPHQSYHADGKRHTRLSQSQEPLMEQHGTPIRGVVGVQPLGTQAISFQAKSLEALAAEYEHEDPKATLSLFLDGDAFPNWVFSLHSALFHRTQEPGWISTIRSRTPGWSGTVLAAVAIPLEHFPEHKLGLIFVNYAGERPRTSAEEKAAQQAGAVDHAQPSPVPEDERKSAGRGG
jgi:hypothetical protein